MGKRTSEETSLNCGSCGYVPAAKSLCGVQRKGESFNVAASFLKEKAESFSESPSHKKYAQYAPLCVLHESLEVQQINKAAMDQSYEYRQCPLDVWVEQVVEDYPRIRCPFRR